MQISSSSSSARTILFLCTGNYYRSRFAESWFNHLARRRHSVWRAESRGLAIELGGGNVGPISADTLSHLKRLGVPGDPSPRGPLACDQAVLSRAGRIIALKESEHRPLMRSRFPDWAERAEYWNIHDLNAAAADVALSEIETRIRRLIEELHA